jgi:hypothetical protein
LSLNRFSKGQFLIETVGIETPPLYRQSLEMSSMHSVAATAAFKEDRGQKR